MWLGCVDDYEDEVGIGQGFHGFLDADAFGFVEWRGGCRRYPRGHRNSADGDGFADEVASGAGLRGDDGAFAFHQAIEEARLADVRAADNGERKAFVHELAVGEAGG